MAQPLPAGKLTVGTRWRYSQGGLHAAFDYPVELGTPVFAVAAGVVLDCNDGVTNKPKPNVVGAPSNWVLLGITHAGRKASVLYQHLSPGINVTKGQKVAAGHQLGESGSSGNATGPHLHLAAMWGHRDRGSRYDYLKGIGSKEGVPSDGTASNEICIFPPSLVYGPGSARTLVSQATVLASGLVFVDKLRFGTSNSDSVKRLQFVLNRIKLKDGRNLKISGNYDIDTLNEATKWQLQKDGCLPGSVGADGNIGLKQARKLFAAPYTVKPHS
ncbi:M23 family metallopeptidase [Kribbella antibiotica]|uniref:M23 family metallopeptidase n=1 Tax=Kribbella antibiotica TaxID=190195 RepID=A0A4R4YJJ2_9ACTN|nr:M23 family metallopeptidase [Kribbella antibiotica]TDD45016.1 M23 family metallopeptidase [Kribbella antibiotica]